MSWLYGRRSWEAGCRLALHGQSISQQRWPEAEEKRGSPTQRCPLSSNTCCWLAADIEDTVWLCLCTSVCVRMWMSEGQGAWEEKFQPDPCFFVRRIRTLSSWIRATEEEGGRTDTEQREVLWRSHNAHVSIDTDCISILLAAQGAHLTLIACTLDCPLTHEIHVGFLSYLLFLLRWPRKAVRPFPPRDGGDYCKNLWFTWAAQHLYKIRVF